jgi:hypothetical protein
MDPSARDDAAIWRSLVESYEDLLRARMEFCSEGVDRVALIRAALRGRDRFTAIYMLKFLMEPELRSLFPELVYFASSQHAAIAGVREAILSLLRGWVVENIEAHAEPLLRDGSYDEYRRFLELYIQLDRDLTLRLARRAASDSDEDIREAGEDYLELLGERKAGDASGETTPGNGSPSSAGLGIAEDFPHEPLQPSGRTRPLSPRRPDE